jgi:hypothetical protein
MVKITVGAELVEALPFPLAQEKVTGFDKLSPNRVND